MDAIAPNRAFESGRAEERRAAQRERLIWLSLSTEASWSCPRCVVGWQGNPVIGRQASTRCASLRSRTRG